MTITHYKPCRGILRRKVSHGGSYLHWPNTLVPLCSLFSAAAIPPGLELSSQASALERTLAADYLSYPTLDPTTQQGQTLAYKHYPDETGWHLVPAQNSRPGTNQLKS